MDTLIISILSKEIPPLPLLLHQSIFFERPLICIRPFSLFHGNFNLISMESGEEQQLLWFPFLFRSRSSHISLSFFFHHFPPPTRPINHLQQRFLDLLVVAAHPVHSPATKRPLTELHLGLSPLWDASLCCCLFSPGRGRFAYERSHQRNTKNSLSSLTFGNQQQIIILIINDRRLFLV